MLFFRFIVPFLSSFTKTNTVVTIQPNTGFVCEYDIFKSIFCFLTHVIGNCSLFSQCFSLTNWQYRGPDLIQLELCILMMIRISPAWLLKNPAPTQPPDSVYMSYTTSHHTNTSL